MSMTLYAAPMSSATPVVCALAELDVPCQIVMLDLAAGDQKKPEYLALNPNGVVPTLVVPEEAIVPEQGRTYVFVVANGRAERRDVRIGKRRPGEVEVAEGLAEGERVIVEGTQNLRDGDAVQVTSHNPT